MSVAAVRLLLRVAFTEQPCSRCGKEIEPGWLYVVGPPVRHLACPSQKGIERHA